MNGSVVYTPDPSFKGTFYFTYTTTDDMGHTVTRTASIVYGESKISEPNQVVVPLQQQETNVPLIAAMSAVFGTLALGCCCFIIILAAARRRRKKKEQNVEEGGDLQAEEGAWWKQIIISPHKIF